MDVGSNSCLNCGTDISLKYCARCGQKTDTKRFSLKYILSHDFIHGAFHLEKGIFFTIGQLFSRPGHAIYDYIKGKRNLFSYISLIILITTLAILLEGITDIHLKDLVDKDSQQIAGKIDEFVTHYPKIVLLIMIPLGSLFSFLWFRKSKQNFAEHLVLNTYKTVIEYCIATLFTLLTIFYTNIEVLRQIQLFITLLSIIVSFIVFYQYFSHFNFTKAGLIIRSFMSSISLMILIMIGSLIAGIISAATS